ncbi:hypothetical protein B566_EDAN001163 [Ephemera danica]|nr:hypothetical protein B566_EDAN001163 [Ephemera danica]
MKQNSHATTSENPSTSNTVLPTLSAANAIKSLTQTKHTSNIATVLKPSTSNLKNANEVPSAKITPEKPSDERTIAKNNFYRNIAGINHFHRNIDGTNYYFRNIPGINYYFRKNTGTNYYFRNIGGTNYYFRNLAGINHFHRNISETNYYFRNRNIAATNYLNSSFTKINNFKSRAHAFLWPIAQDIFKPGTYCHNFINF